MLISFSVLWYVLLIRIPGRNWMDCVRSMTPSDFILDE